MAIIYKFTNPKDSVSVPPDVSVDITGLPITRTVEIRQFLDRASTIRNRLKEVGAQQVKQPLNFGEFTELTEDIRGIADILESVYDDLGLLVEDMDDYSAEVQLGVKQVISTNKPVQELIKKIPTMSKDNLQIMKELLELIALLT